MPLPAGATWATPWNVDAAGRLYRITDLGQRQLGNGEVAPGQCVHCTAPLDDGDTCGFCSTYTPPETPAQRLDVLANRATLLYNDVGLAVPALPDSASMAAVLDLVVACRHLRDASIAIGRAIENLEAADAEAVQR